MADTPNIYASLTESETRWITEIHLRARTAIRAAFDSHGRNPGLAGAIARARVTFFDGELAPVIAAMATNGRPVDCKKGCAACCTLKVEITPDEVFALAAELDAALDAESLAEARRRAAESEERGRGLPPAERHLLRLVCPVLEVATGACRGHAVRPAACQGYLSLDRLMCEAAARGTPTNIPKPVASDLIRDAVNSAQIVVLEEAGLDQSRIELAAGLVAAWADPDAERRWLAGGKAFAPAI